MASDDQQQQQQQDKTTPLDEQQPSAPAVAEDSNLLKLAPCLSEMVDQLDENADKFDHIMAFFVTVMAEFGYKVSCLYDENNDVWSKDLSCIPKCWKPQGKNTYDIDFILYHRKEARCKLIGIPVGDWLVLNLLAKGASTRCRTRSMSAHVLKHINMHQKELGKFWHLKELGLKFKNMLLAPLHGEMMMEIGVAGPSLQGLPHEIKVLIADMLDKESRRNLEKICNEFTQSADNASQRPNRFPKNQTIRV